jgi:cation transporter-like permease
MLPVAILIYRPVGWQLKVNSLWCDLRRSGITLADSWKAAGDFFFFWASSSVEESAASAIFSAALMAALRCGQFESQRDVSAADSMLASGSVTGGIFEVVGFSIAGAVILLLILCE